MLTILATSLAGCSGIQGQNSTTPQPAPRTYWVSPDGDDENDGTDNAPLASIQAALDQAKPGDTVHVQPGRYRQSFETVRPGTPDAPITITGPPDAVVVGSGPSKPPEELGKQANLCHIHHDHIHLTGLTFDGLHDPAHPNRRSSYRGRCIRAVPPDRDYEGEGHWTRSLTDLKLMPHAVGNVAASALNVGPVTDTEIGAFRVIGPIGVDHFVFDEPGVNGEVIYLGYSVPETRNVHIHHVANTEGYPHSELVDAKWGTREVRVEYCTDVDGAVHACVRLGGKDSTVRWSKLHGSRNIGILLGMGEPRDPYTDPGTNHAVYRNSLLDNETAIHLMQDAQPPSSQRVLCENTYNTPTNTDGDGPCPEGLPGGDGIGHTGGQSPFRSRSDRYSVDPLGFHRTC